MSNCGEDASGEHVWKSAPDHGARVSSGSCEGLVPPHRSADAQRTSSSWDNVGRERPPALRGRQRPDCETAVALGADPQAPGESLDRKSTRLNSSHSSISYAVF